MFSQEKTDPVQAAREIHPSKITSPAPGGSPSSKELSKEKEKDVTPSTLTKEPVTRKSSEGRRSPVKATRARAIETEDVS